MPGAIGHCEPGASKTSARSGIPEHLRARPVAGLQISLDPYLSGPRKPEGSKSQRKESQEARSEAIGGCCVAFGSFSRAKAPKSTFLQEGTFVFRESTGRTEHDPPSRSDNNVGAPSQVLDRSLAESTARAARDGLHTADPTNDFRSPYPSSSVRITITLGGAGGAAPKIASPRTSSTAHAASQQIKAGPMG